MSTIREALALVFGLSGEPTTPTDQLPSFFPTADPRMQLVEQLETDFESGNISDPQTLNALRWRLENLTRQMADLSDAIEANANIRGALPEIENIISSLPAGAEINDNNSTWAPIYTLQSSLEFERPDGIFGPQTAQALLGYVAVLQGGDYAINLHDYPFLDAELQSLAETEHAYLQVLEQNTEAYIIERSEYETTEARLNDLIINEFRQCGINMTNLHTENPFAEIVSVFPNPYAQLEGEIRIASDEVANAIGLACGHYFEGIDEDVKHRAITNLSEWLQAPLETEINRRWQQAISEHEESLRQEGYQRGIEEGLNLTYPNQMPLWVVPPRGEGLDI